MRKKIALIMSLMFFCFLPGCIYVNTDNNQNENNANRDINSNNSTSSKAKTNKKIIALDAGHQAKGDLSKEPIGPGASETKYKVSYGTCGNTSGLNEYELTLVVTNKLKNELISRGYNVVMIRESNNVNIRNSQRAEIANNSNSDIFLRIHANSDNNSNLNGIITLCQTPNNPYISNLYKKSRYLSHCILESMIEETNATNRGVWETDSMSGINWCEIPVTIVEMGFMSNPKEDTLMSSDYYQNKLVQGMANGVDKYFEINN